MTAANDNYWIKGENGPKRLPDGWEKYDKTGWTHFGPIGSTKEGFVYLDPEIAAWRSA